MASKTARAAKPASRNAQRIAATQLDMAESATRAAASNARHTADAAFASPSFEMPEMFRSVAEQGLSQTREAYGRMKTAAEETTNMMEGSFETTRESVRDVQFKALDAARANAEATFDFARDLLAVTSVADAIQLQTAFARERFEAFVDYSKEVQNAFMKVSAEAGKPAKAMLERTLSQTKAA